MPKDNEQLSVKKRVVILNVILSKKKQCSVQFSSCSKCCPFVRMQALSPALAATVLQWPFQWRSASTQPGHGYKALLQVIDVPYRHLVDAFVSQFPDPTVDWIEVWWVCWLETRSNEVCSFTSQQFDDVPCTVCRCAVLLEDEVPWHTSAASRGHPGSIHHWPWLQTRRRI